MQYVFGSSEWVEAVKVAINTSTSYREAARQWEGDFWFVVEPEDAAPDAARQFIYFDLWHGECREAFVTTDESRKTPEFRIWATPPKWRKVLTREVDPIKALMTNTLKLKGPLAKVMRNVKAAQELVLAAAAVPTHFGEK
jgi:putative sterol carrier protein